MSWLLPWNNRTRQEIEWNPNPGNQVELDFVLVKGKKVATAPGLRISDESGLAVAKRSGWILGFGKLEQLICTDVFVDWFPKQGVDAKLKTFTNALLNLEQVRIAEKITLTQEQRNNFAQKLCDDLIRPTGVQPELLTKEGYFVLRSKEEHPVNPSATIQAKKEFFAQFNALPPVIATSMAMKALTRHNDLLDMENAHETSSILFDPKIKNSTLNETDERSIIAKEYDNIANDISNITLQGDVAMGNLTNLLEQTILTSADPDEIAELERSVHEVQEGYSQKTRDLQQYEAKLEDVRNGMEEEFLNKQAHFDVLN